MSSIVAPSSVCASVTDTQRLHPQTCTWLLLLFEQHTQSELASRGLHGTGLEQLVRVCVAAKQADFLLPAEDGDLCSISKMKAVRPLMCCLDLSSTFGLRSKLLIQDVPSIKVLSYYHEPSAVSSYLKEVVLLLAKISLGREV